MIYSALIVIYTYSDLYYTLYELKCTFDQETLASSPLLSLISPLRPGGFNLTDCRASFLPTTKSEIFFAVVPGPYPSSPNLSLDGPIVTSDCVCSAVISLHIAYDQSNQGMSASVAGIISADFNLSHWRNKHIQ